MAAQARGGVCDLVVVLQVDDKARCRNVERRCPAVLLLPGITLPLEQETVFGECDELGRSAAVIAVIGLPASGKRDLGAVVKIVIPDRVETIAAFVERAY